MLGTGLFAASYSVTPLNGLPEPGVQLKVESALKTSVVIVSYNSHAYLEECILSVVKTTGENCEVIVVDNASEDGSERLIADKFPFVKLLSNRVNTGFAAAANQGVASAKGDFVICLNPDTVVTEGWLEALLAPLIKYPQDKTSANIQIGLTTPRILMLKEPAKVNTCGNSTHFTGLTFCRGLNLEAEASELKEQAEVPAVSGACFAIRREVWDELDGFDETFFTYLEDTDLSIRARLLGYRCLYVPEATVYHDYANRFSPSKIFYLERNRYLLLLKTYRLSTILFCLPALLMTEIITWGYAIKNGPAGIKARFGVWRWILANFSQVKQKRQRVQLARRLGDGVLLSVLVWRLDISQLAGPKLARIANYTINPFYGVVYLVALKFSKVSDGSSRKTVTN